MSEDAVRALWEQFPRWTFWYGTSTGLWWAAPPPGLYWLLSAPSAGALAELVAEAESWH